ncbi:helix-turn-helix domain-containing protein [Bradyrhizobium sp. S69]|uniref:helix-turn-helix domain-containing protein n=1 Tax=Bradyrhizobium sp. S69 TaxID=1641856 RepID=UPI00131CC18F|nr:helix-turn-helix domain-containing protein [Bradyrhizobium sp. S69]
MGHGLHTGSAPPERPRQFVWETNEARPVEQFAYYREAICQAFMNLTPEPPAAARFRAKVESVRLGQGALNRVSFPQHIVRRTPADIAASRSRCYYLNLKLAGRSHIQQAGRDVVLSPGQVGIFDSGQLFALHHDGAASFKVASFWVPYQDLHDRLPGSFDFAATRLSDDPFVGHLIAETARTLNSTAQTASESDSVRLFDVMLDLVALSLSRQSRARTAEAANFADATVLALQRAVHDRLRQPSLSPSTVAAVVGISERYVHKLFERTGSTFAAYVIDRRLDGAAADLTRPALAGRTAGAIAFDWGFSDLSHFTRRFKQRFGCTPGEWRHRPAAPAH